MYTSLAATRPGLSQEALPTKVFMANVPYMAAGAALLFGQSFISGEESLGKAAKAVMVLGGLGASGYGLWMLLKETGTI